MQKLKPEEIATIYAVYQACDGSTQAHPPIHRIRAKFIKELKENATKWVERVARKPERYIQKHTNGEKTYSITMNGIRLLKELNLI